MANAVPSTSNIPGVHHLTGPYVMSVPSTAERSSRLAVVVSDLDGAGRKRRQRECPVPDR